MRLDGGGWMLMHFGMTGSLAYFRSPEEEPSHSRLLFAFENEDTHASSALSPSRDLTRLVICSSLVEWNAWLSHPSQSSCEYPLDPREHAPMAPTAPSSRPTLRWPPTPIRITGPSFTVQLSFEGDRASIPQLLLSNSSVRREGL